MIGDVLSMIQDCLPALSKSQKRIAQYVLENFELASYQTANTLSKAVGVSESTVGRFAIELGYDGFPSFQRALRDMVLHRLTSLQRLELTNSQIKQEDVFSFVLQTDVDRIRQTERDMDREMFRMSVEALSEAKNVYVIGVRSTGILAQLLGHYLSYMFENVKVITTSSGSEVLERMRHAKQGDVVIGLSFPRYSSATMAALRFCKANGATVICLTDREESVLNRYSDYLLVAKTGMVSFADSLSAPMSVINALIAATARKRERVLKQNLKGLEAMWDKYHVYEKSDT